MIDFEKRKNVAKNTLFYVDKIAEKFVYKVRALKDPYEEFKVLVHDTLHPYDNDAIKLAAKTFKRKGYDMRMTKYRILSNDKGYAYIFALSKIK